LSLGLSLGLGLVCRGRLRMALLELLLLLTHELLLLLRRSERALLLLLLALLLKIRSLLLRESGSLLLELELLLLFPRLLLLERGVRQRLRDLDFERVRRRLDQHVVVVVVTVVVVFELSDFRRGSREIQVLLMYRRRRQWLVFVSQRVVRRRRHQRDVAVLVSRDRHMEEILPPQTHTSRTEKRYSQEVREEARVIVMVVMKTATRCGAERSSKQ